MSVLNLAVESAINKSVQEVGGLVVPFINDVQEYDYNLVDNSKLSRGVHISNTGAESSFAGNAVTGYIKVSKLIYPSLKILLRLGGTAPTVIYGYYFYDENRNIISYNYTSSGNDISSPIDIPDKAAFIRLETYFNTSVPLRLWIVMKYACFNTSWFDLLRYNRGNSKNLLNLENYISDFKINASGEIIISDNNKTTPLIPVTPNKQYFKSWAREAGSYLKYLYMYDGDKNFIGYDDSFTPIWTAPSNCEYVAFNITDLSDKTYGLFPKDEWDGVIGDIMSDNDVLTASLTASMPPCNGCYIIGVYENHLVIQRNQNNTLMYYSSNGWDGPFTEVNLADMEGYELYDHPDRVMFFETASGIRSIIFASHTPNIGDIGANKMFCSTTGPFSGFEQPDVWDLKGSHHWRIGDDDKDPTGERYRKYYPVENTQRQNRFIWHNGPVWFHGLGGQYSRGLAWCNYTNNYVNNSEPSCLFYTEDGKNVYVQYEFGVYQKYYKRAGNDTVRTAVNYNLGDDLDFTEFSGTHSLSIKRRYNILPSAAEKDPTNIFEYGDSIAVSSISGKNVTLSSSSGLNVGDTIIFVGTGTGDYAKILNNDASATVGGQTAFVIKSISGDVITLADVIGNVQNNLMCRHIHGVAEFGQGLCIYTGEEYPESWFIYLCPSMNSNSEGVNMNNSRWTDSVVRLNAAESAFQRALGIYLRSDSKVVYIADSNSPYNKKLEVRGKDINMGGYGIFVFSLSEIDDTSMHLSKLQAINAGYCLYFLAGKLFFSDYNGNTYYSEDEGDTWKFICKGGFTKNVLLGFDKNKRRFYFNTGNRNSQFVIEFKK